MTDKRFGATASERAGWSGVDAVDGSSTGIAMCQIAVVIQERLMSAYGTKQTFQPMPRHARFWV
jgi:hypothetical protein